MDTISVRIPAFPQYVQVVRLVAAGLASRLKFTIDDIEDLKIAVDELTAYLTGTQGREGTLQISFTIHDDRLEIRGVGQFPAETTIRTDLTAFSRQILETVADHAALQQDNGLPSFTLVKNKRP